MSERDQVLRDLPPDFVRQMRNWARSRAGLLGGMGITMSSIYEGPIRYDRSPEAKIPVLQGDATDVQICLSRVPVRFAQAVELFWDHEGASFRQLARKTGKTGVNNETFKAWVMRGHEILRVALETYRLGCRVRKANAQALGAGA